MNKSVVTVVDAEGRCSRCNGPEDTTTVCRRCLLIDQCCRESELKRQQEIQEREQLALGEFYVLELERVRRDFCESARRNEIALLAALRSSRFWQGMCFGLIALSLFLSVGFVLRDPSPANRQIRELARQLSESRHQNEVLATAFAKVPKNRSYVVVAGAGDHSYDGTYLSTGSTISGTPVFQKGMGSTARYLGSFFNSGTTYFYLSSRLGNSSALAYTQPPHGAGQDDPSSSNGGWKVINSGIAPAPILFFSGRKR